MSGIPDDEAAWKLLNLKVDTFLKAEQHRWLPWQVIAASAAAGAGLMAGLVALMTLILHLAGRL